ncbi:MAG: filamentous hemagglutinin N-terminal domain-containing protein, partial [Thiobacillus sp.]|nr:filamentous hemagglutinin N-terminal domain-containing protein [Thiobacillus sp.]
MPHTRTFPSVPRRLIALSLALLHGLLAPLAAIAEVVPTTGGNTSVYLAPNGVPVVNIATANAAGLSHNYYIQFDVDSRGLILNNGNYSQIARDAILAGQIMANLNLREEASVILNEVVAPNRSSLAGYLEVLGRQADVIIANPWGITCNGCGFINTPRATLTTGTPDIGAGGNLAGFEVDHGDVLIEGNGLDGKSVDVLDIVARSIMLDGQANGKDLGLIAGANHFGYARRDATAIAGGGVAPTLAIDSSVLGGMYANRIKLVATEAGVGVRMLGDAAASADDLQLDAAGNVTILSRLSAERDLRVTSTAADSNAIQLSGASLAAKRDLTLADDIGGIDLAIGTGNNLYAGGALALAGNSGLALADAKVLAAGNVDLTSAAGGIGIAAGTEQRVQSTSGNVSLTAAGDLTNAGYVAADAGNLTADAGGGIHNSGTLVAKSHLALTAVTGLANSGSIAADGGSLSARVGALLDNSGALYAKTALTVTDSDGGATENLDNSGTLISDGSLSLAGAALVNSGGIQGGGDTSIRATSLDNAGKLIGASQAGTRTTLTLGSLLNRPAGVIQAVRDLTVDATSSVDNRGTLMSGGNLTIQGRDTGTTLAIGNANGAVIQAGAGLTLQGASGGGNATLDNQGGSMLGDSLALKLASLDNSGLLQAGGGVSSLAISGALDNRLGATLTLSGDGGTASLTADILDNAGRLQSRGDTGIAIGSQLNNSGSILGAADLSLSGATDTVYAIDNSGTLQATGLLSIKGHDGGRQVNLSTGAAGVVLAGELDMNAGTVALADGAKVSSSGNLTLVADTLSLGGSNAGILAATGSGDAVITLANTFTNPGMVYSGGNLTLTAPDVNNGATGGIVALDNLTVVAAGGNLNNAGAIYGGNRVNLNATGTFTNVGYLDHGQGTVDSGGDLSLTAAIVLNQSTLGATRDITIQAPTFRNEVAGGDTRAWVYGTSYASSSWTDSWYSFPDNYEREYHVNTWTDYQYYAGGKPTFKPQIIGGSSVTVRGFDNGYNTGGVISGPTLNIIGNGGGASFVNDGLALIARDWRESYDYYTHYIALGPAKYTDHQFGNYTSGLTNTRTIDSLGSVGLYATTLNAAGFALANNGAPFAAAPAAPAGQTAPGTGDLAAPAAGGGLASGLSFGGINLRLPDNPNGYFVVSKDPNAHYLVETNPLFGVGQNFVGSHYLEERYGYNPDTIQKHLGNANYELLADQPGLVIG